MAKNNRTRRIFIVLEVCFQNLPQGSFVEDHDVVQALSSQGADETLRIGEEGSLEAVAPNLGSCHNELEDENNFP